MKIIDVEGLPEPVAQAVAAMVEALREELHAQTKSGRKKRVKLPTRPGKVLGLPTREEIYEDVG